MLRQERDRRPLAPTFTNDSAVAPSNMADISSILPVYGSEEDDDQGDYDSVEYSGYYEPSILDQVNPDDLLSPVEKMKKYCISENIFTRQMVARNVVETIQTVTTEKDCHTVLQIIHHLSEDIEPSVRTELVEQLPSVCIVLSELQMSMDPIPKYILPIIVRYLTDQHNQVRKSSQSSLLQLMEHDLITRDDVEQQVCPVLIQLTEPDSGDDFRTEAVTLMTKITTLVGADITERLFLSRFGELCSDPLFHIRKECAANFGDIATVVGQSVTERALLHLFSRLCQDGVWGVRKSCAETFMAVSESCSREMRYEKLAPLFVNLLCDMSRWVVSELRFGKQRRDFLYLICFMLNILVQMAAYQALGQFIATFAEPIVAGFKITEQGLKKCPIASITNKDTDNGRDCDTKISEDPVKPDANIDKDATQTEERIAVAGNVSTETSKILVESNGKEPESHKTEDTVKQRNDKTTDVPVNRSDSGTQNDTGDDNDEVFNSFQFWKSPLPEIEIDYGIATSPDQSRNDVKHQRQASVPEVQVTDTEKPDEVIYLSKQLSETFDFDIEEENSLNSSETLAENSLQEREYIHAQTVIPPPLLEHYISMTEPTKAQTIDTELARHCAFTFPGAVLALGKDNWPCLKDTYELLASDMQWKVRRTLAFSIHDLALVLGEEITVTDLIPIFNGFLKDLDEVRIGVLKHLYDFIRLLPSDLQKDYLQNFADFLNPDNNRNWRFRQELAEQLIQLSQLYEAQEVIDYIFPIALAQCGDKVADVRSSASRLLGTILKQLRSSEEANQVYVKKFVNDVINMGSQRQTWVKRKVCAQICQVFLTESVEDASLFATDFLPSVLKLAADVVPNVRIVAAKTLTSFTETEFFQSKTEDDELHEVVMKVLEQLRADDDQDVRYFAGAKSFEEVSLFSDDVTKHDGLSSEELDEEHRQQESTEDEEKIAVEEPSPVNQLITSVQYRDIVGTDKDSNADKISDEKLDNEIEIVQEDLQNVTLSEESVTKDDKQTRDENSSAVVVEGIIDDVIERVQTP